MGGWEIYGELGGSEGESLVRRRRSPQETASDRFIGKLFVVGQHMFKRDAMHTKPRLPGRYIPSDRSEEGVFCGREQQSPRSVGRGSADIDGDRGDAGSVDFVLTSHESTDRMDVIGFDQLFWFDSLWMSHGRIPIQMYPEGREREKTRHPCG